MGLGVSEYFLISFGEGSKTFLNLLEFECLRLELLIEFFQDRRRLRHIPSHAHFIVIVKIDVRELYLIEVVPKHVAREGLMDIEYGQSRRDKVRNL